jgi:hypothetical protein
MEIDLTSEGIETALSASPARHGGFRMEIDLASEGIEI